MTNRSFAWVVLALGFFPAIEAAQTPSFQGFFPLSSVRRGMEGVGKTVFEGSAIETFGVEILGVIKNSGPKRNLILAKLSGQNLEEIGVFSGMSGSPVYIEDRLVGAVAFAFNFSKIPIAGITPIQEMIDIFKEQPGLVTRTRGYRNPSQLNEKIAAAESLLPAGGVSEQRLEPAQQILQTGPRLTPIATPLSMSGFSSRGLSQFTPELQSLGLSPFQGSGRSASQAGSSATLEPGSTVAVQLVRGDMEVSASGTVTHISGDKVYAFGHPFMGIGSTELPMSTGTVLAIVPNLMNSFKFTTSADPVGAITQDRATGILGVKGAKADLIAVKLNLKTSRNQQKEFDYEVVASEFLTPLLLNLTVFNSIVSSERALGQQTLLVKSRINVKGQKQVLFENNVTHLSSAAVFAAVSVSAPVQFLLESGFSDVSIDQIDVDIEAVEENRGILLENVWQEQLEAKPGEEVRIRIFLRHLNGKTEVEEYPVKIPTDLAAGEVKVLVGDGTSVAKLDTEATTSDFVPKDLPQLIRAINNVKKNDRLYIRLFREEQGAVVNGVGMPDLPPSLIKVFNSKKTSGEIRSINKVIYSEYELPAKKAILVGEKTLTIQVKS